MPVTVSAAGSGRVNPAEAFRLTAQQVSKTPAADKYSQSICKTS
jgi:hypothetical protein